MHWIHFVPKAIRDQLRVISKIQLVQDILINVGPSLIVVYVLIEKTEPYFSKYINTFPFIALSLFGACILLYYTVIAVHSYYTRNIRQLKRNISTYTGQWAVVTGASSPIGTAFCLKLASYGMNILLIGRNQEKLQQLVYLIQEQTQGKVKTRILVHDFTHHHHQKDQDNITSTSPATSFKHALKSKLDKYSHHNRIGMLIHCANYRNDTPTLIHEMDCIEIQRLFESNVDSTIQLIQTLLPYFIQQNPKGGNGGAIITVSTHACHHPAPLFSLYTATNAFRSEIMKSLFHRCKELYNIDCISVTPELISFNLPHKVASTTFVKSPSANRVVENTLRMLGYVDEAFPFRGHAQTTWIPQWIWVNPWDRFLDKMKCTRAEILKKQIIDDH